MKTNKALLEERNRLNGMLQKLVHELQKIDLALNDQVPSLRVECGFDRTSTSCQLAWLCLELQLQPADRVILLEELRSREASIEQFLLTLQQLPTPTISAALASLPSCRPTPDTCRINGPWRN